MTPKEVRTQYNVDNHGIIRSPGKFDGEPVYAPAYWEVVLNGMADDDNGAESNPIAYFNLTENDRQTWPELDDAICLALQEDDNGFVHTHTTRKP